MNIDSVENYESFKLIQARAPKNYILNIIWCSFGKFQDTLGYKFLCDEGEFVTRKMINWIMKKYLNIVNVF